MFYCLDQKMSSQYHNEHQTTCSKAIKRTKLDFKNYLWKKGYVSGISSLCLPSLISTTHFLASRGKKTFINSLPPTFRALIGQSVKPEGTSPENYHEIYSQVQLRYIRSRGPIKTLARISLSFILRVRYWCSF